MDEPVIDQLSISEFKDPQVKKKISGGSTFYIPSVTDASVSPLAQLTSEDKLVKKALSELANHQPGKNYAPLWEGTALAEAVERLALNPKSLEVFKANRRSWIDKSGTSLTDEERRRR
jgi:hypothetical protein